MIDQRLDPVVAAFRESAVYRSAIALRRQFDQAARESLALTRARAFKSAVVPATSERSLAGAAMMLAWASLAHLAIRSLLPRYATSGLPAWWNIAIAVFAFAAAALAPQLVRAWEGSTPARWWRRPAS